MNTNDGKDIAQLASLVSNIVGKLKAPLLIMVLDERKVAVTRKIYRHKQALETERCYPTHTGDNYAHMYSNTSTFRGFHKANKATSIRVVLALINGMILNVYYM